MVVPGARDALMMPRAGRGCRSPARHCGGDHTRPPGADAVITDLLADPIGVTDVRARVCSYVG